MEPNKLEWQQMQAIRRAVANEVSKQLVITDKMIEVQARLQEAQRQYRILVRQLAETINQQ